MDESGTPPDPARDVRIARQEASLRRFAWLLLAAGAVFVALGAALGGVDFAVGVLLGFLIVLLNFYWTKKAVRSVLFASQPKGLLTLSFLVKFGVTGAVLFYAILRLHVDALGVLVGLSTLLVASVLLGLGVGQTRRPE
jgi:hypothetical protein